MKGVKYQEQIQVDGESLTDRSDRVKMKRKMGMIKRSMKMMKMRRRMKTTDKGNIGNNDFNHLNIFSIFDNSSLLFFISSHCSVIILKCMFF